jgi:hypothetical protein
MLPIGLDWLVILPAVQEFSRGKNPYLVGEGFHQVYEPFWTYLVLTPFSLGPYWLGRGLLFVVSLIVFAYTAHRMGAARWQLLLFLCSSSVVGCLNNGNLDWLVTLGLVLPIKYGLFFVLIKPQVGIGIAIYWMFACWFVGGWHYVLEQFAPVTVYYLVSFLWYGLWPLELIGMNSNPDNMSAFPWTVPIGIFLMYISIRLARKRLAMFSGPLLAPYVSQFSYSVSLLALLDQPRLFVLAWVLLWIPVLVRVFL